MSLPVSTDRVVLHCPPGAAATAWAAGAEIPSVGGRWAAYINYLCQLTLTPWLEPLELPLGPYWPDAQDGMNLWSAVGGFRFILGEQSFVVIPSDSIDTQTVSIPQEWVDLLGWAADYYLAVQVLPDDGVLQILGCFSYEQVKQAPYQPFSRSFEIAEDCPYVEFDALVVAQQLGVHQQFVAHLDLANLPSLSASRAATILMQTQQKPPALVRLMVPFEEWGALVSQDEWRQSLGQQLAVRRSVDVDVAITALGDWLHQGISQGWQALEEMSQWIEPQMTWALRQGQVAAGTPILKAGKLLSVSPDGTAALLLTVSIEPVADGRRAIQVHLYPLERELFSNLTLSMDVGGQTLQSVTARPEDRYIQLKQFKSLPDQPFSLIITTSETRLQEPFLT